MRLHNKIVVSATLLLQAEDAWEKKSIANALVRGRLWREPQQSSATTKRRRATKRLKHDHFRETAVDTG